MVNLKTPELELFKFFEKTPDLVCLVGKDGFFKKVNPAVIDKLGFTYAELYASAIESFIHIEDKEFTTANREILLSGETLHNFVNRYVTKNGQVVWLEWTSIYFSESEIVFAIAKDITERKKLENDAEDKYTKFKGLASHFKSSLEKDRKSFAYELHEELAQLAAVIKLDVKWIVNNVTDLPESSKSRIDHAAMVAELLIKKIQKISFSVSPVTLDYFGLKDTLQLLVRDFSILHGISCIIENNFDEASLSQEMKTDFFRICQEALTNIIDQAQATNVKISIEDIEDKLQLTIIDDGKGFDIHHQKQNAVFASMQGRVASINGQLTVQSKPGGGTRICVLVLKDTIK